MQKEINEYNTYWERCWGEEDLEELRKYLDTFYQWRSKEIDIFKAHDIQKICDAACGFGAYSLAFASNVNCIELQGRMD